jgi:cytochrome aa3-600 menaquinol oxidase subunit IV
MEKRTHPFPIKHVLGFLVSLVMTFAAAIVALKTSLSFDAIMWIIGTLAIVQAALQLFLFMHVREGEDANSQTVNIAFLVFCALVIVAGTIWVMSFNGMYH